jgi:hypothetical protein
MSHDLMTRCQHKKDYRGANSDYSKWIEVSASQVVGVAPERLRCMHCHGAVRLHGAQDHVEHHLRQDSEHCQGGIHFQPPHQRSTQPVK